MKRRVALLVLLGMLNSTHVWAAEEHPARGIVVDAAAPHQSLVVSCDAIPGYMDAMEMSLSVRDSKALATLKPGMAIS